MSPRARAFVSLLASAILLLGCENNGPLDPSRDAPSMAMGKPSGFATRIALPSLSGRIAEARAVDNAGTVVAGYAHENGSGNRAVKWTLQANGSWAISALPNAATATGAIARAVNRAGDVAGSDFTPHVVLWPATGGFSVLGCSDLGEAHGISADAQVVVGGSVQPSIAAVWRPGSCREDLPLLAAGGWSRAHAVNGDGTIVGGAGAPTASGDPLPVRWVLVAGAWQIEQLDSRNGAVFGANSSGDLAGYVQVSCAAAGGCQRAVIWYAAGGSRELGTLGGEHSYAWDINAAGEVVGGSTSSHGLNTAFFWSESLGMLQLPVKGRSAAAFGISDVRPDGTRLVVGSDSQGQAVAWTVRNP